jgi:hypothetical protein
VGSCTEPAEAMRCIYVRSEQVQCRALCVMWIGWAARVEACITARTAEGQGGEICEEDVYKDVAAGEK